MEQSKTLPLMTHLVAGYPDMATSAHFLEMLLKLPVEYAEVQIPFTDPIADGPTILTANQAAIAAGVTVENVFEMLKTCAKSVDTKMVVMTYANIALGKGLYQFCAQCSAANVWGTIIPDLPFDSPLGQKYVEMCHKNGVQAIPVVSPLTTDERLNELAAYSPAFVYCTARAGLTGEETAFDGVLANYMARVKQAFPKAKLGLGFGLKTRFDIASALQLADTAIIGSELVRQLNAGGVTGVQAFLQDVRTHIEEGG